MIKVNTATLEATREPVPTALKGLTAETLRNLQTELNPVPADYTDIEYWPEVDISPTLTETQKYGAETLTAVLADKTVERNQAVVDKTSEELEAEADALAAGIRNDRDQRIALTDWTGMSDVTMTAEMSAYRQALRDITIHANFPDLETEDWPVSP